MTSLMDRLDVKFEATIKELDSDSRVKVRNFKNLMFGSYNFVKPVLIAIAMFWLFYRIQARIGTQETILAVLILNAIFLRSLNKKLG